MKYAVQYRNMHDALHYLAICNNITVANDLFDLIESEETEAIQDYMIIQHIEIVAINWRNPPRKHNDESLKIINQTPLNIPDIYW